MGPPLVCNLKSFFLFLRLLCFIALTIKDEYKKYNGFGSYRGFYSSSTLSTIMKDIRNKNRALQTLSRPLKIWMNTILYRPPDKYNNSLRYEEVKANFENNKLKQ